MNRYIIGVIIFCLFSCNGKDKVLPKSIGAENEILIVIEDFIWEGEKGDIIKSILQKEIYGLNQPEPIFNTPQVNRKEFSKILRRHKNIIIFQEEEEVKFHKNKWAQNQVIFQIDISQSEEKITQELNKIAEFFAIKELKYIRSQISSNQFKEAQKKIQNKFQINAKVPSEYTIIKDTTNLFWIGLKKNKKNEDEIHQIIIYSFYPKTKNIINEVISTTDIIFSKNLYFYSEGIRQKQHVEIYKEYEPIYEKNIYRGFWRTTGKSFMGGPFLAKHYTKEANKVVVITAIIYAPNKLKRKYVKRVEAMFLD